MNFIRFLFQFQNHRPNGRKPLGPSGEFDAAQHPTSVCIQAKFFQLLSDGRILLHALRAAGRGNPHIATAAVIPQDSSVHNHFRPDIHLHGVLSIHLPQNCLIWPGVLLQQRHPFFQKHTDLFRHHTDTDIHCQSIVTDADGRYVPLFSAPGVNLSNGDCLV